jgi:hypothetical protein
VGSFVPWTGYFRFTLLQKGASAVANYRPAFSAARGRGGGSGGRVRCKFAQRIIRKEGPKSRKMGFPWSSQLCSISAQCACAHNSLSDVVPRLWNPIIIVVVIRDPLTIGDAPMCSTGIIDRQSWYPHWGCGGAPRNLVNGLLHVCCVKKPIKGRSWKLHFSISEEENGDAGADRSLSLFWTLGSRSLAPWMWIFFRLPKGQATTRNHRNLKWYVF